jgi:hypothetical protein
VIHVHSVRAGRLGDQGRTSQQQAPTYGKSMTRNQ